VEAPIVSTDSLGQWTISRTFELTARSISAFAAGVGDYNERYFDDTRPGGLSGHPGMVFSFQWNTRHLRGDQPGPEVARLGVHAGTDVRYTRPLRQGDSLTVEGQQIALRQIPAGVLSTTRVTMRDPSGAVVVEMDNSGILRTAHLEGPPLQIAGAPQLPVPAAEDSEPVWSSEITIDPFLPHVYTECTDIWNAIHTERQMALAAGLPGIILHGSATMTLALRELVNRNLSRDPEKVRRLAGEFRAMVIPGETITVRCLQSTRPAGGGEAFFFDVLNQTGQKAVASGVLIAG
jgi:acyl dehydratase